MTANVWNLLTNMVMAACCISQPEVWQATVKFPVRSGLRSQIEHCFYGRLDQLFCLNAIKHRAPKAGRGYPGSGSLPFPEQQENLY
jgi:hypothetical protein